MELFSQTPLAAGRWPLAILGLPLMALSVAEAYAGFTSVRRTEVGAYLPSVLAMLAGNLLLLSSALVLSALMILLIARVYYPTAENGSGHSRLRRTFRCNTHFLRSAVRHVTRHYCCV